MFFPRKNGVVESVRPLMRADFAWIREERPEHLQLYRLLSGDCRQLATTVACHQEIAGDSVLSVGMLAEFDQMLAEGSWLYRRLFWEAGMIGQVLYLEAEAAGLRGTGIGCYFDDAVHEVCGLTGDRLSKPLPLHPGWGPHRPSHPDPAGLQSPQPFVILTTRSQLMLIRNARQRTSKIIGRGG